MRIRTWAAGWLAIAMCAMTATAARADLSDPGLVVCIPNCSFDPTGGAQPAPLSGPAAEPQAEPEAEAEAVDAASPRTTPVVVDAVTVRRHASRELGHRYAGWRTARKRGTARLRCVRAASEYGWTCWGHWTSNGRTRARRLRVTRYRLPDGTMQVQTTIRP